MLYYIPVAVQEFIKKSFSLKGMFSVHTINPCFLFIFYFKFESSLSVHLVLLSIYYYFTGTD